MHFWVFMTHSPLFTFEKRLQYPYRINDFINSMNLLRADDLNRTARFSENDLTINNNYCIQKRKNLTVTATEDRIVVWNCQ